MTRPQRSLAVLVLLAAAGAARADTSACTPITSLPASIDAPGKYCLASDFVVPSGGAALVQVNASDVVLDCNDHTVRITDPANTVTGIYVPNARHDVVVRHCRLDGFYVGIFVQSSTDPGAVGNRIEDNQVVRARSIAIYVVGSANRVERNHVSQVLGDVNGVARGIYLYSAGANGAGNIIRDNTITDFRPIPPQGTGNPAEGIVVFNARDTLIADNLVSGLYAPTNHGVWGIQGSQGTGYVVTGNIVLSSPPAPAPLDGGDWGGIRLSGTPEEQATFVCRDNIVGHFNGNISGCIEIANTEL